MKSNCIFYALARWFREGGFIVIRKSHYGWWPHMLWSPDLHTFEEFAPLQHNHHLLVPPPIFRGVIKTTVAAEQESRPRMAMILDSESLSVSATANYFQSFG